MKNLLILIIFFISYASKAQFVITGFGNNSDTCSGYALIQDSSTVISVQTWNNESLIIQSGGYAIYNLCQGTYTVSFNTLNGSFTETFIITNNPCVGFIANFNTTFLTNPTACDGTATISVSGGTAPYNFIWNNLNTASQASNLCNGYYSVNVSDMMGCISNTNFYITEDSTNLTNCFGLSATMTTTDATSNLICDGMYSISVLGGTTPYSYYGDNGANTQTISNLCSGIYNVTIIDASGCSVTASGFVNNSSATIGDTIIFNGTIINDSTVIGTSTSSWIENCTFDYTAVVSASVISHQSMGDSTLVTWEIGLNNGTTILIDAVYQFNSGFGVYNILLQLTCSQKNDPKFLLISGQINYQTANLNKNELFELVVFPNPIQDEFNITGLKEISTYKIIDMSSRLILSGKTTSESIKIDVTHLKNGNYIFVIENSKGVLHYNLVK